MTAFLVAERVGYNTVLCRGKVRIAKMVSVHYRVSMGSGSSIQVRKVGLAI